MIFLLKQSVNIIHDHTAYNVVFAQDNGNDDDVVEQFIKEKGLEDIGVDIESSGKGQGQGNRPGSDADISANGGWTDLYIGPNDLIAGPGTDLNNTYFSTSDATLLDIQRVHRFDPWRIDIGRSDINWYHELQLYVRRTGNGNGNGRVFGGWAFREITNIDRIFLVGIGRLNNIPLQYRLSGVSLQVPPDTYSTTIIFTIMSN